MEENEINENYEKISKYDKQYKIQRENLVKCSEKFQKLYMPEINIIPLTRYMNQKHTSQENLIDVDAIMEANTIIEDTFNKYNKNEEITPYDYDITKVVDNIFDNFTDRINNSKSIDLIKNSVDDIKNVFENKKEQENFYSISDEDFSNICNDVKDYAICTHILECSRDGNLQISIPFSKAQFEKLKEDPNKIKEILEENQNGLNVASVIYEDLLKNNVELDADNIQLVVLITNVDSKSEFTTSEWTFTLKLEDDGFVVEQNEPVQKIDNIITKIENETENKGIKQIEHEPDEMEL